MIKTIVKTSPGIFRLTTENIANSQIILNFNPIITQFNLNGNYCLVHWQARPKGYREWGIFDSKSDRYFSVDKFDFTVDLGKTLQINDQEITALPSAVIYFPNAFYDNDRRKIIAI